MCGPFLWGMWWIFPLVMCLGFVVMAFFASTGHGFMCVGGHPRTSNDRVIETHRDISAKDEQIR